MIRRSSRFVAVMALVVGLAFTPVGPRAAAAPGGTEATTKTPIRHLVVMTQDQHSFDNYFGLRSGVDGIPSGVCVPVRKASVSPCVKPFRLKGSGLHEPIIATKAVQVTSIDGGRMDGFVHAQSSHTNAGRMAMGYYAPQDLPIINELADHAVLFDHWFTSVQGGSVQNRLFAVAAQSTSDQAEVPIGGWRGIPLIFDRLQDAGVSWRIDVENYEPALTIDTAGPSSTARWPGRSSSGARHTAFRRKSAAFQPCRRSQPVLHGPCRRDAARCDIHREQHISRTPAG